MKLKQWLYGATALAMLAACSDKDIAPRGDSENVNGFDEMGNSYLAVQINLPQESVTRALPNGNNEENDQFDDGLVEEYEVKNGMLVLFKGTTERNATFYKAWNLTKPFFENDPTTDNITSSYIAAVPVDDLSGGNHYYGLVILNREIKGEDDDKSDETTVPTGSVGFDEGVKIGGTELTSGTTTIESIIAMTSKIDFKKNGFFMTNAPLSTKKGSESSDKGDIHYLADLGANTYTSLSAAKEAVKTNNSCIYVERALAKVTGKYLYNAGSSLQFVDKNGNVITDNKPSVEIEEIKYMLNNTNDVSYIVRNVEKENLGDHFDWNIKTANSLNNTVTRMIGEECMNVPGSPYHTSTNQWYRTYWCHDPNYNVNIYENGTNKSSQSTVIKAANVKVSDFKSLSTPLYCRENTFDVKHQEYGNSTLAVFKVTFKVNDEAKDLFIKDGNYEKIYTSKEDAAAPEISAIYASTDIQTALQKAYKASGKTGTLENAENYLDIQFGTNADSELIITDIDLKVGNGSPFSDAGRTAYRDYIGYANGTTKVNKRDENDVIETKDDAPVLIENKKLSKFLQNLNSFTSTVQFTGGVSYYQIPIKHFGDYYCPWDKTKITGTTTSEVYDDKGSFTTKTHASKYLGRYGMVRNNWYELYVTKFSGLGSPTFPDIELKLSDDNNEVKTYMALEIHVLSWAKRTQNVEF